MSQSKGLTQNKKKTMHEIKLSTSTTYLFTNLCSYIVWPTHLGQPIYLRT
jgi:hypothetical protein